MEKLQASESLRLWDACGSLPRALAPDPESDPFIIELRSSVKRRDDYCNQIVAKIDDILETTSLKDNVLDALMGDLLRCGLQLEGHTKRLRHELSGFRTGAESLKRDVCHIQTIQKGLTDALLVAVASKELRHCEAQLRKALMEEDFERATKVVAAARRHLAQAESATDAEVTQSLAALEKQLIRIVGKFFRQAIASRDSAAAERFAKLFYPLNMHQDGIAHYLKFLRETLSNQCAAHFRILATGGSGKTGSDTKPEDFSKAARRDGESKTVPIYAEVLREVFAAVVCCVHEHQENLKTEFGPETYLEFLRGLEEEADIQAVRVLDQFQDDHKDIFQESGSVNDTLATADALKEADLVLDELALLSFRCHQVTQFLQSLGKQAIQIQAAKDQLLLEKADDTRTSDGGELTSKKQKDEDAGFIATQYSPTHGLAVLSAMIRRVQELMGRYVAIEHTFARRSVDKAMASARLSLSEKGPQCSTLPDDVFFVLRKSITRAIDSCDDFAVCAIVNLLSALLSSKTLTFFEQALPAASRLYSDWLMATFGRLDIAHKSYPEKQDFLGWVIQQSHGAARSTETECPVRLSWPHLLNDLATCVNYTDLLFTSSAESFHCRPLAVNNERKPPPPSTTLEGSEFASPDFEDNSFLRSTSVSTATNTSTPTNSIHAMFQQSLLGLTSAKKELKAGVVFFSDTFVATLLQPLLTSFFRDFEALDMDIDRSVFADYQVNDPFIHRFTTHLKALLHHLQTTLISASYETVSDVFIQHLTARFEDILTGAGKRKLKPFSLLGAMQLETDLRTLQTALTPFYSKPIRPKFSRLMEIAELLGTNSVEEFRQLVDPLSMAKTWRLSLTEMRRVMESRTDLSQEELEQFFTEVFAYMSTAS